MATRGMIRVVIGSILCLSIVWSCVHDPFPVPDPPIEVNPGNTYGGVTANCVYQDVCFESSVLPIFMSACAKSGCHDALTHKEGFNLTSYAGITKNGIVPGKANESKLYKVTIASGEDLMPPPPDLALSKAQRDTIAKWINQGAKNTVKCNCSCDTTKFTFATVIDPLIKNACVGCHSAASPGGNIDLSSYSGIKSASLSGKLLGSVTQVPGFYPMPKGGKLSDCQINQIKKWIAAGSINN